MQYHPGFDRFDRVHIRDAADTDLSDGWMRRDDLLHIARPDLEAAGFDEVLLAVHDEDVTILILVANVSGEEPAVPEHDRGFLRFIPIAFHDLRRAQQYLSDLASLEFVPAIIQIDDADFHIRQGDAD